MPVKSRKTTGLQGFPKGPGGRAYGQRVSRAISWRFNPCPYDEDFDAKDAGGTRVKGILELFGSYPSCNLPQNCS
jgi:hypothetical protein